MTDTVAVAAHGLTKSYRHRRGIEQVTFEVGHGQICGLLGPNGATVSQLPEPRPQPVAQESEPRCQASTGNAHKQGASTGGKPGRTGSIKMTWSDKTPGQYGCAARDSNPRIKSPLSSSTVPRYYLRLHDGTCEDMFLTCKPSYRMMTAATGPYRRIRASTERTIRPTGLDQSRRTRRSRQGCSRMERPPGRYRM